MQGNGVCPLEMGEPPERASVLITPTDAAQARLELCGTHWGYLWAVDWAAWPDGAFRLL